MTCGSLFSHHSFFYDHNSPFGNNPLSDLLVSIWSDTYVFVFFERALFPYLQLHRSSRWINIIDLYPVGFYLDLVKPKCTWTSSEWPAEMAIGGNAWRQNVSRPPSASNTWKTKNTVTHFHSLARTGYLRTGPIEVPSNYVQNDTEHRISMEGRSWVTPSSPSLYWWS